ncbi:MAG TPA: carboxylate-amine ligase [Alphaproteobacteria bacterium]|jgi:carboxylate-amine ligase|nr:carboxylate-amine ligase [Alphaproteobacteria bacterium]
MSGEPPFTIGIEEEYLLVRRATRDLVTERPAAMMSELDRSLAGQVTPEFLNSQIEVGTRVCGSVAEVSADLRKLRRTVAEAADRHGLAIVAASTHPSAHWDRQTHTDKERYNLIARDLQGVVRRLLICGMHIHVGLDDDDLRIDLMSQIGYFLPHLLALSTSSPFWRGYPTGLKSYRISVFDELPRTGIPEHFDSYGEFQRQVRALISAGLIEDGTKLWWDIRPSARFPTLEMRVCDIPTYIDDTICVAALYLCLMRMLWRLRRANQRWRRYASMLVSENRWRAQRYGFDAGLVDFGKGVIVPYPDLLEEILALVHEDAQHFNCLVEIEHARTILKRGTSAHRQVALFEELCAQGMDRAAALDGVIDRLIAETVEGL